MYKSLEKKLISEVALDEAGFIQLYKWQLNKKYYLICLCSEKKHICIMTPTIVKTLRTNDPRGNTGCLNAKDIEYLNWIID